MTIIKILHKTLTLLFVKSESDCHHALRLNVLPLQQPDRDETLETAKNQTGKTI